MRAAAPGHLRSNDLVQPALARPGRCIPQAEDVEEIAAASAPGRRRALPDGVHNVTYGKEKAKRILRVANIINAIFDRRPRAPLRRRDPDREHDPPLDLRGGARSR